MQVAAQLSAELAVEILEVRIGGPWYLLLWGGRERDVQLGVLGKGGEESGRSKAAAGQAGQDGIAGSPAAAVVFAPCSSRILCLLQTLRRGGVDETDLASLLSNPQVLREQRRVRRVMPQVPAFKSICSSVHKWRHKLLAMFCDLFNFWEPLSAWSRLPCSDPALQQPYHAPHAAYLATHAPACSWSCFSGRQGKRTSSSELPFPIYLPVRSWS